MVKSKHGKLIYGISSALIVLLGISLIICSLHIFFTGGDTPYSRERVGEYLIILLAPAVITLGFIIGGLIYADKNGDKLTDTVKREQSDMLSAYARRVNLDDLSEDTKSEVLRERRSRKAVKITASVQCAAFFVLALIYFILCKNFTVENLNGDVILALAGVLPLSLFAILSFVPTAYVTEKSAECELKLLRDAVANGTPIAKAGTLDESEREVNTVKIARLAILAVAIVFVIIGIFNGGMADVLAKAVKICTECIGLG